MKEATTNIIKGIAAVYLLLATACSSPTPQVNELWEGRTFASAQEIIWLYDSIAEAIGKESNLHTKNLCHYVWSSGEYIFKCRGKKSDITELPARIEELHFDNETVNGFMVERDTARFADHYMTLEAMQRGATFEEARDGLTITVFYKAKPINSYDYNKLRTVFSCKNNALHEAYLRKMFFPFRNSGCNEELYKIRPLIEQNVAESPLKQQILALYDNYLPLMPGNNAPDARFIDTKGREHKLSQYKGKVIVIDVWATWCSSCLAKMPKFMELSQEFKNNSEIQFLTVSIDRHKAHKSWLTTIVKRDMGAMTNLTPDCEEESPFETAYHISGIPRYIIIDQEGRIVTAYAPGPDDGMKEIILKTLRN